MRGTIKWNEQRAEIEVRLLRFSAAIKDRIKGLPGARWDASARVWRVPPVQVGPLFDNLEGETFSVDDEILQLLDGASVDSSVGDVAGAISSASSLRAAASSELRLASNAGYDSVSRILERVSTAIRGAFGGPAWVSGTLSSVSRAASGHIYMDLSEEDAQGRTVATLSAVLFASHASRVDKKLHDAGVALQQGLTVAFRGQVDAYMRRGTVQLLVEDCDPAVSRGEIELQRQRVVQALGEAGLIGRNAMIPLPDLPRRIALITAADSDAYHDVLKQLREAQVGAELLFFPVAVQGDRLESTVLDAFARLNELSPSPEMAIVCRGGGAANELAAWDNLSVATAIATARFPVVVGIGHERDRSALDEVAHRVPTPTAAGRLVAERWSTARQQIARARERLQELGERQLLDSRRHIQERSALLNTWVQRVVGNLRNQVRREIPQQMVRLVEHVLSSQRITLDASRREMQRAAVRRAADAADALVRSRRALHREAGSERLQAFRKELDFAQATLIRRAEAQVDNANDELRNKHKRLELVHPQRVLERGFAIVRSEPGVGKPGAVVRDAEAVDADACLQIQLSKGQLRVRVEQGSGTGD